MNKSRSGKKHERKKDASDNEEKNLNTYFSKCAVKDFGRTNNCNFSDLHLFKVKACDVLVSMIMDEYMTMQVMHLIGKKAEGDACQGVQKKWVIAPECEKDKEEERCVKVSFKGVRRVVRKEGARQAGSGGG